MSAKECMETKDGIGWLLESADSIFVILNKMEWKR